MFAKVMYKRRTPQIKHKQSTTDTIYMGTIPNHMYVDKSSDDVVDDLDSLAHSEELQEEYEKIEDFVTKYIEPKESVSVASIEELMPRNRYRDLIPYDSNIVYLSQATGNPPSTYINASWVN